MSTIVTLICDPERPALDSDLLARARDALPGDAATAWLAPGVAADLLLEDAEGDGARAVEGRVREALGGAPVDVVVQPPWRRRKRLLVADMESTMIGQECLDELADHLGLRERIAAITERAMRGEIAFEPALRERVALLEGLDAGVLRRVLDERVRANPGALALVRTMRAAGAFTALVSGGFTAFTEPVAEALGFHVNQANRLVVRDERLAGTVEEPILGREAKREALERLAEEHGVALADSMAVGDGANDLGMIGRAGLGVAYRAKPLVAREAAARVEHGDLTALLYMQGYRREEFVTSRN